MASELNKAREAVNKKKNKKKKLACLTSGPKIQFLRTDGCFRLQILTAARPSHNIRTRNALLVTNKQQSLDELKGSEPSLTPDRALNLSSIRLRSVQPGLQSSRIALVTMVSDLTWM